MLVITNFIDRVKPIWYRSPGYPAFGPLPKPGRAPLVSYSELHKKSKAPFKKFYHEGGEGAGRRDL
jgi:hypothetical protein